MQKAGIPDLKKKTVSGIVALSSRTFFLQLISLVALFVVGAYLQPKDVGIYVAVTSVMRIVNFFTDFGFGAAIIQKKKEILEEEINTAFSVQMAVTLAIFLVFFLFNSFISGLLRFGEEGKELLLVLMFTLFLSSFKTIPSVMLERSLKFEKVVIPQIIEAVVFNLLLVVFAVNGFGVRSYSVATLFSSLSGIPAYYFVYPWKIRIQITANAMHMLFYGVLFQAKGILGTIKDDMLTTFLIVSKLLDYASLGLIGWWQRWAFFSFRFIVDSITKVTFSTYSRIQNDKSTLKDIVEKSLYATAFILFPIIAGLILTAPKFIAIFPKYQKWEPGLLAFNFFCLNAAVSSLSNILVTVLDAMGRVKTTLKLMVMWTVLTWVLTPLLVWAMGYNGVAIASFVVTITIVITIYLVKQIIQFGFLKSIIKPLFCTLGMSVVLIFMAPFTSDLTTLFFAIVTAVICYFGMILLISRKETLELLTRLKSTW